MGVGTTPRVTRRTLLQASAAGAAAVVAGASLPAAAAALAQEDKVKIRWESRADPAEYEFVVKAIDEVFHVEHPNIEVTIERAPDQNRDERLLTSMVAGTAPDLFETWSDNVTQFADRDQVVDVQPLVDRDFTEADIADFVAWQWRDFVLPSGIRFGVPKYINVMTLWCNIDKFEAAGQELPTADWTHEEYAAAARALSVVEGKPTDVYGLRYPVWSWDRYWYKVEAFGGQVVNPDDRTECLLGSPEALAAFEWSRGLEDEKALVDPLSIGTATDPSMPQWAAQRFAMHEDGFYPVRTYDAVAGAYKFQYAEVPTGPAGKRVLGTTDGYAMFAGADHQDAAWELAKYLSGPDFQVQQVQVTARLPGRQSVLDQYVDLVLGARPELEALNLDAGVKAAGGDYAGSRALFVEDAAARQIIEPALESVYVSMSNDASYFEEIAQQVTEDQRSRAN
jgi:multiple sugar transport system substrate-binding protein